MRMMKAIAALVLTSLLGACGGGGDVPVNGGTGGGTGGGTTSLPTISVALSSSTVSESSPTTLTATLKDEDGKAVSGQIVNFSSSGSLVAFDRSSAVTNSAGLATVQVFTTDPALNGADQLSATATVDETDLTGQIAVSLVGESPSIELALSSSTVTSTEPATVRAAVKGANGAPVANQVVTFSTSSGLGVFDATTAATDASGIATVILSPATLSTAGADFVNAAVTVKKVAVSDAVVARFAPSTSAGLPTLSLSLSSSSVSSGSPVTVTAVVLDSKANPIPGRVVTFSSLRGLGAFSVSTALTDAAGKAVVLLTPSSSTASGADEVISTVSVQGSTLQLSQGFQVQASSVSITAFTSIVGNGTLSAYGQTSLSIVLAGVSVGSPVNLAITSSCLSLGKAVITPATFTTTTSTSTIQYKDNGCGALQSSDKLQVSIVGSSAPAKPLSIKIGSPDINSVAFVSATPSVIYLKGSGFGETSQVTFELLDSSSNPLPNQPITMTLVTLTGGVKLEGGTVPVTRLTNDKGQVTVRVNSGTVPTPVRVIAEAGTTGIKTVSSGLSVAVGLPSELNFSLSQGTINIEGGSIDGTTNTYTIIAADRSGNPVPIGTSINFVTEGGQVEPIKQIQLVNGIARTTANFVTSEPRPDDGRVTVVAYALGEESFLDQNGNNVHDSGEPFQDLGNIYRDRDFDGAFDVSVDEYVSLDIAGSKACKTPTSPLLSLDASIPSVGANTCDGVWGRAYVRRATETILSTSSSRPLWIPGGEPADPGALIKLRTNSSTATTDFYRLQNSTVTVTKATGSVSFLVADANGVRLNPMPAGTTITAQASTGATVLVLGGTPVPSTRDATVAGVSYDLGTLSEATVIVKIRSPGGLETAVSFTIVKP